MHLGLHRLHIGLHLRCYRRQGVWDHSPFAIRHHSALLKLSGSAFLQKAANMGSYRVPIPIRQLTSKKDPMEAKQENAERKTPESPTSPAIREVPSGGPPDQMFHPPAQLLPIEMLTGQPMHDRRVWSLACLGFPMWFVPCTPYTSISLRSNQESGLSVMRVRSNDYPPRGFGRL